MDRLLELDNIINIEINNKNVSYCENAKKRYFLLCKELDGVLLEYSKGTEAKVEDLKMANLMKLKTDIQSSIDSVKFTEKYYGNLEYDFSYVKKNKFKIIMEELVSRALHPKRLERYLELGGDIDDF